jgi:hypothetical protein
MVQTIIIILAAEVAPVDIPLAVGMVHTVGVAPMVAQVLVVVARVVPGIMVTAVAALEC